MKEKGTHLGVALGPEDFKMKKLSKLAKTHLHTAFSAYINGEQHKFTCFLRSIDSMSELIKPLDKILFNTFLPAVFGKTLSHQEKKIISSSIREVGLGIEERN